LAKLASRRRHKRVMVAFAISNVAPPRIAHIDCRRNADRLRHCLLNLVHAALEDCASSFVRQLAVTTSIIARSSKDQVVKRGKGIATTESGSLCVP
jgi:hypothetical protein